MKSMPCIPASLVNALDLTSPIAVRVVAKQSVLCNHETNLCTWYQLQALENIAGVSLTAPANSDGTFEVPPELDKDARADSFYVNRPGGVLELEGVTVEQPEAAPLEVNGNYLLFVEFNGVAARSGIRIGSLLFRSHSIFRYEPENGNIAPRAYAQDAWMAETLAVGRGTTLGQFKASVLAALPYATRRVE